MNNPKKLHLDPCLDSLCNSGSPERPRNVRLQRPQGPKGLPGDVFVPNWTSLKGAS